MRCAVLSDIHGNLYALRAVLESLRHEEIDRYLCLGDIIGYGPCPVECVGLVAELDALCVAGNHELVALEALSDERCGRLAQQSLAWTKGVLDDATRRYLSALPQRARASGVVLAHGSLDDPQEYVQRPGRARELLARLDKEDPSCRVLLLGHTHHSWAYSQEAGTVLRRTPGSISLRSGQRYLLNPGSVGQSRDRVVQARFMVLDLARNEAHFRSIPYDVRGHSEMLRRAGLPARSYQMVPRLRDRTSWRVRSVARQLRGVWTQ